MSPNIESQKKADFIKTPKTAMDGANHWCRFEEQREMNLMKTWVRVASGLLDNFQAAEWSFH